MSACLIGLAARTPGRLVALAALLVCGLGVGAAAPATKPASAPPLVDEVVVDNRDAGFRATGAWRPAADATGRWGADYLTCPRGDGHARATWTLVAPHAGRWQVQARWPAVPKLAVNAAFDIVWPGEHREVLVDQGDPAGAGRFYPLAVRDLKGGDGVTVSLTDAAESTVAADAVRLVRLPSGCAGAEPLYESAFAAGADAEARSKWVMEGGGAAEWADGYLRLAPTHFTPQRSSVETEHFVYWLNQEFPADVAAEWDFRFPDRAISPNGVAILFFCAAGTADRDIFDPALAKREGVFTRYHSGDILCFHVSFLAGDGEPVDLYKNPGLQRVASGSGLVAQGGPSKWHHLRLTRFGREVVLSVDGRRCLTWSDDGETHGPLMGSGKIGIRQQNDLLWGDYANVRVWGLGRD